MIALAFATSLGDAAIIPVLPEIRDGFGLSGVETGMLLSATTLAMLGVAVPVGLLAGRLGTRRLLLTSAPLLPLSMLGQALAAGARRPARGAAACSGSASASSGRSGRRSPQAAAAARPAPAS